MRSLRVGLVVTAACLAVPAIAQADDTICLSDPTCPLGGIQAISLDDVKTKADAGTDHDVIRIGPGTYATAAAFTLSDPATVIGAGMGATIIDYSGTGDAAFIGASTQASISRLTLRMSNTDADYGVRLSDGADAFEVAVLASSVDSASNGGFILEEAGSLLQRVRVELTTDKPFASAIYAFNAARVEDSYVQGGIGLSNGDAGTPLEVRRTTIRATVPIRAFGGRINASNVLLTPHPQSNEASWRAIVASNGNTDGDDGIVTASNVTIDGRGQAISTAISVESNGSVASGSSSATIEGAVIRNVGTALLRNPFSAALPASLIIRSSSYDGTKVVNADAGMWGTFSAGATNLTSNADPRWLDPANLDYRLRFDSPLIDRGDPTPLFTDQDPDIDGDPRVHDSDGDGSERVDIGAQEYQRLAPTAAISAGSAFFGEPSQFGATATDPDGEGISSFAWGFGDGTGAAGAQAAHQYAAPGSFPVTLTVQDASGLSTSVAQQAAVDGRPGRCANARTGGAGADRIVGFAFGDRLLGSAGNDSLLGELGDDCLDGQSGNDSLFGGAGADRLDGRDGNDRADGGDGNDRASGGKGKDRLAGAAGNDVLTAGPGAGRVSGGSGNDVINTVNRRRDRVDCGSGRRDRVKADRTDRLKRCERVKRVGRKR